MYKHAICLPVYNGIATIKATVSSILPHLSNDVCLIISDNCSTDGTATVIDELVKNNPHVYIYIHDKNVGFELNFMRCATAANTLSCNFISFIGDDDYCLPEYSKFLHWMAHNVDPVDTDYVFVNSRRYTDKLTPIADILPPSGDTNIHTISELSEVLGLNVAFTPTLCFRTKFLTDGIYQHIGTGWFFLETIYRLDSGRFLIYPNVCTKFREGSLTNVNGKFFHLIKELLKTTDRISLIHPDAGIGLQNQILTTGILKTCYTQKLNDYRTQLSELKLFLFYCRYSRLYGILFLIALVLPKFVYKFFHLVKNRSRYVSSRPVK